MPAIIIIPFLFAAEKTLPLSWLPVLDAILVRRDRGFLEERTRRRSCPDTFCWGYGRSFQVDAMDTWRGPLIKYSPLWKLQREESQDSSKSMLCSG